MECLNCKQEIAGSFCTICGTKLLKSSFECLVTEYFRKGFTYVNILDFLQKRHSVQISLTTLKKKLKSFGLKRRRYSREDLSRTVTVQEELSRYGNSVGLGTDQCGTI